MRTGKDYGDIFDHHAVEYTYADGTKMFGVCRQMPGCEPLVGEFAVGTKGEVDVGNGHIKPAAKSDAVAWEFPRPRGGCSSVSSQRRGQNARTDSTARRVPSDGPSSTTITVLPRTAGNGRAPRYSRSRRSNSRCSR